MAFDSHPCPTGGGCGGGGSHGGNSISSNSGSAIGVVYGADVGHTNGGPPPEFPQPPWIPMASGGAMYLSAADEVPDEVWV